MEVAFRHVHSTTVLRDEGMRVTMLAARVVELEPRAAGQPDSRYALVVERRGELIQPAEAASSERD